MRVWAMRARDCAETETMPPGDNFTTGTAPMRQCHIVTFRHTLGTRVTGYARDATCRRLGTVAHQRATWRDRWLRVLVEYGVYWDGEAMMTWEDEANLAEAEP